MFLKIKKKKKKKNRYIMNMNKILLYFGSD